MTTQHPFGTRKGRRLREAKLRDCDYLCEPCRHQGRLVEAVEVHHRIALKDGGPAYPDLNGLEAVCDNCHRRTHGARPKVRVDPKTGLPLPGSGHWWID